MQAYTGFAQVYDIFMDNVPYDEWANYLAGLLQEYGLHSGLVLELGCGTGSITRRLAAKGYDMIGIDISEEMLEIARDLEYNRDFDPSEDFIEADELQERNNILYLQQDMREFELYGTVSAVVSICDSMNYITSEEELLKVFQLVNNYLDRGGTFIFDMNTVHKYKDILADNTFAENREACSFEYDVTIFVKVDEEELEADEKDTLKEEYEKTRGSSVSFYEKYEELHYQKAYTIDTVIRLIEKAGMEFITVYDAFTRNSPDEESERVYFVAREKHQENKLYI